MKDSIDFGKEDVGKLFRKMLYPTILGMIFSALFIITDGMFVGRGLGSDALAAVNIVAPVWLFGSGVGLMFGMGASVVASIHLSQGRRKTACINVTQAVVVSTLFLAVCATLVVVFSDFSLSLLGCSERLLPLAREYMIGFIPFMPVNALLLSCGFYLRLGGAPRFAMTCTIVATILNVILDYLFIFPLQMGVFGAAIATSMGSVAGAAMMLWWLARRSNTLHFVRVKASMNSLKLTVRNIGYMCRLGTSSFLCELAIACLMMCGNFVFIDMVGEDGVAAFSIACYFFPIVFMLNNAVAQAMQPIISYNYGISLGGRVHRAFMLALRTAVACGGVLMLVTVLFSNSIASIFLDSSLPAHDIAARGLPLFAVCFIPFAVNIVSIGYFQSVEQVRNANIITMLRGFALMILSFAAVPRVLGVEGIWLSLPVSEIATMFVLFLIYRRNTNMKKSLTV